MKFVEIKSLNSTKPLVVSSLFFLLLISGFLVTVLNTQKQDNRTRADTIITVPGSYGYGNYSNGAYNSSGGGGATSTPVPTLVATSIPTPTVVPTSSPDTIYPSVVITNPLNGSQVKKNANINITAAASDNVGVDRVEFYVNGVLQCTKTSLPYTCAWKVPNTPGAQYTLQAKAFDAAGNNASSIITVSVK